MSNSTKPGVEAPTQWGWVETTIWTERMLAALGNGVKVFAQLGLFTMKEA